MFATGGTMRLAEWIIAVDVLQDINWLLLFVQGLPSLIFIRTFYTWTLSIKIFS